MNRHWQFEARMSLTGANADVRVPTCRARFRKLIIALHDHLAKKAGASTVGGASAEMSEATAKVADELWAAREEPGARRGQRRGRADPGEPHQLDAGQLRAVHRYGRAFVDEAGRRCRHGPAGPGPERRQGGAILLHRVNRSTACPTVPPSRLDWRRPTCR